MNEEAINLMTFLDDDNNTDACTIRLQFDKMNNTVKKSEGVFITDYRMFVDD